MMVRWPRNVTSLSAHAGSVRYTYLRETSRKLVLGVALICTAAILLSLGITIALYMADLRRRVASTGRGAA